MKILFFLFTIALTIYAQSNEENIAKKTYQANINALMVFTSQEGLNSGYYRFTKIDTEMDIYHLPFTYHLDSNYENINFFVIGNVGYSRTILDNAFQPSTRVEETLTHENQLRTYTGGLGMGIRYHNDYGINFLTGIEVIYSQTGFNERTPDDNLGDAIKDFFDNNYNDNLTYKILAQLEYRKKYKGFEPYALLSYKLYETKADFSLDDLTSFTTQASVLTLGLGVETPQLYIYDHMYLTLEGYLYTHYFEGDIVDVVQFDKYHSLGAVAYWYTPKKFNGIKRFFLEVSNVSSSGLEGYNIGVGFTIDF